MRQGSARELRLPDKAVIGASVSSSLLILDIIFFRECCTCRGEELGTGCESWDLPLAEQISFPKSPKSIWIFRAFALRRECEGDCDTVNGCGPAHSLILR